MNAPETATLAERLESYTLQVTGAAGDAEDITSLREACGGGTRGMRTAVGLAVIYEALHHVVRDSLFPLPFAGIVHVEQSFTWGNAVDDYSSLQLSCSIHDVVVRPRMALFTLSTEAVDEHSRERVVHCEARMMAQRVQESV